MTARRYQQSDRPIGIRDERNFYDRSHRASSCKLFTVCCSDKNAGFFSFQYKVILSAFLSC